MPCLGCARTALAVIESLDGAPPRDPNPRDDGARHHSRTMILLKSSYMLTFVPLRRTGSLSEAIYGEYSKGHFGRVSVFSSLGLSTSKVCGKFRVACVTCRFPPKDSLGLLQCARAMTTAAQSEQHLSIEQQWQRVQWLNATSLLVHTLCGSASECLRHGELGPRNSGLPALLIACSHVLSHVGQSLFMDLEAFSTRGIADLC